MRVLPKMRAVGVVFVLLPLAGCMGLGDMFREKRFIAGDYFLMEGEADSTDDLYLFADDDTTSIAGPLDRIGWNQQYVVFTDIDPRQWDVINVKEHHRFKITDLQRTQDSRFQQIAIGSASEAWQRAETQGSN